MSNTGASMMWEVGKKYTTANNTDPRKCLKVTYNYVLLDAQEKFSHSRPVSVERVHWDCWKEYKEPVVLKAWIPVLQHPSKETYISLGLGSVKCKEYAENYIERNYPNHTILDMIEVTWQEKE